MLALLKLLNFSIGFIFGVALFRAALLYKPEPPPKPCIESPTHHRISLKNDPKILDRFLGALNIPTISYKVHTYDGPQMTKIIKYIEDNYPAIHSSPLITREVVSNYSLLYTIKGSNPNLRPYMLTSHLDVVPAVYEKWSSDPFKATLKGDGYIYARGTMDAKHLTMSIIEAVEHLLKQGFKPRRTLYLAFGHDGES